MYAYIILYFAFLHDMFVYNRFKQWLQRLTSRIHRLRVSRYVNVNLLWLSKYVNGLGMWFKLWKQSFKHIKNSLTDRSFSFVVLKTSVLEKKQKNSGCLASPKKELLTWKADPCNAMFDCHVTSPECTYHYVDTHNTCPGWNAIA